MSAAASLDEQVVAAEREWLAGWIAGPVEPEGTGLVRGASAPALDLLDHTSANRKLSEFWADGPALVMFWRHFGCGCGIARAQLLVTELEAYRAAGLTPVIIAQGEPARAAAYRERYDVPCPILSDPNHVAYRAFGLGQWTPERILADAPAEFWAHPEEIGVAFQEGRRSEGRPLVDDPWRQTMEFVVGADGRVRLTYAAQHCDDLPRTSVLTAAARLS